MFLSPAESVDMTPRGTPATSVLTSSTSLQVHDARRLVPNDLSQSSRGILGNLPDIDVGYAGGLLWYARGFLEQRPPRCASAAAVRRKSCGGQSCGRQSSTPIRPPSPLAPAYTLTYGFSPSRQTPKTVDQSLSRKQ